jgi:hypothetical protein
MISPKASEITRVVRLSDIYVVSFAASPGGLRWTNDPSAASQWSSASANWAEFRVLSMRLRYVPSKLNYSEAVTVTAYAPVNWYVQRDTGAGTPTSMTQSFQFDSARPASIQQEVTMAARSQQSTEMAFQNVRAPGATYCIGVNQDSLTALTAYGLVFVEVLVQFRSQT